MQIQRADQLARILSRARSDVVAVDYAEATGFMGWGAAVERSIVDAAAALGFVLLSRSESGVGPRFRWFGAGDRTLRLTFERAPGSAGAPESAEM
jgi:hypothetical protein